MQSNLEREAIQFIKELQAMYFEHRAMDMLASLFDARVSWIGVGRQEFCGNAAQALLVLERERHASAQPLKIVRSRYEAMRLSPQDCLVYGRIDLWPLDGMAARLDLRVSAVCRSAPDGMKLLHAHFSSPDFDQEEEAFYASKKTRLANRTLRRMVEQATEELQQRNGELEALLENLPSGIHCCRRDEAFTLLQMSDTFLALFGYTRNEVARLFQNRFIDMIHPDDRAHLRARIDAQLALGNMVEAEYRIVTKDGTVRWVFDRGRLAAAKGQEPVFYCMMVDITARKKEREAFRLLVERHKVILNQTSDIIFEWDVQRDKMFFSDHWQQKFGYPALSENLQHRLARSPHLHPADKAKFAEIMQSIRAGALYREAEFRVKNKLGEYVWCRMRSTTQFDDAGRPVKAIGVIVDIDAEKREQERLLWQAERDALTGLYNKNAVKQKVQELLRASEPGLLNALLIIDVDDFKEINDRFGHLCGDAVLSDIARQLRGLFRATDVVGRIGGDEFLVFMPQIQNKASAAEKAQAILRAFARVTVDGSARKGLACSIGIALHPRDADGYTGLYHCADQALYRVKEEGKHGFAFYEKSACRQNYAPEAAVRQECSKEFLSGMCEVDQTLINYIFQLLYNAVDTETGVHQILQLVGKAYDVSRVYIFENTDDDRFCSNTFEWCNEGVPAEIDRLQHLSYEEDLGNYLENFDENGVFYCQDITPLHPFLYRILAAQGIVSLVQCVILDDGKCRGFVGFDECRRNRYWTKSQINTLSLISKVLSTFLLKLRFKERLVRLENEEKGR